MGVERVLRCGVTVGAWRWRPSRCQRRSRLPVPPPRRREACSLTHRQGEPVEFSGSAQGVAGPADVCCVRGRVPGWCDPSSHRPGVRVIRPRRRGGAGRAAGAERGGRRRFGGECLNLLLYRGVGECAGHRQGAARVGVSGRVGVRIVCRYEFARRPGGDGGRWAVRARRFSWWSSRRGTTVLLEQRCTREVVVAVGKCWSFRDVSPARCRAGVAVAGTGGALRSPPHRFRRWAGAGWRAGAGWCGRTGARPVRRGGWCGRRSWWPRSGRRR